MRRPDVDIVHLLRNLILVFLLSFPFHLERADANSPQPATVVVLAVDHVGWNEFARTNLPNLNWLRMNGAVSLLSPGLPRLPDPEADNWAEFTAGDVINTKNDHIGLLSRQLMANGDQGRVYVISDIGLKRLDVLVGKWRGSAASSSTLIVCSITPSWYAGKPGTIHGWDALTPLLICGPGFPAGSSMTSATTRTRGLVALRDLAPEILTLVDAPIPQSMTGAAIIPVQIPNRDRALGRMETVTRLGEDAIVPISWFLGLSALMAIAGGMYTAGGGAATKTRVVCYLLRLVLCAPLAMLIAPCIPIDSLGIYVAALIGINLLLALIPSVLVIQILTAAVIVGDGLTGTTLIASSVISGYWLSGIRFYGIGNEYMGVLIAAALLVPALAQTALQGRLKGGSFSVLTSLFFLSVIFVLSYPAFGAKAGGAVTSVAALGPAWYTMTFKKKPTWQMTAVGTVVGFILVFALAALAQRLHSEPSHIQTAVSALHRGRLGYIRHVAIRKAKMAIKTVLTPGGYAAIVGLILVVLYWKRSPVQDNVSNFLADKPELSRSLGAGFWALITTLLFNDSGSVAFLFFFGAMSLVILHELVRTQCVSSH